MKVQALKKIIISTIFAAISTCGLVFASQSNGTILTNVYSSSATCTDLGCTTGNTHRVNWKPTAVNNIQPINITDSGITGQAWGEVLGWVNFDITPVNNIAPVTINPNTGALSGYAWAQNSGWINFSPTAVNNISGVSINGSGEFTGAAWVSGPNGGFMKFDCGGGATSTCVKTDWVPIPYRTVVASGGGGSVVGTSGLVVCTDTNAKNYLSFYPCQYDIYQQVTDKPDLIGGINPDGGDEYEPNVPPEFSKYVCKRYLRSYIYPDRNNKPEEVKKLQSFLNDQENEKLTESGVYDEATIAAVKRFQTKYKDQILAPWGFTQPTGIVGRTTVIKINLMSCAEKRGCPYFNTYMNQGDKNIEAVKIQDFLNIINAPTNGYPTNGISLTKEFTRPTFNSVKEFQTYYKDTVLKPWGLTRATGWWYQTTRYAANKLMNCSEGEVQLDNGKKHKW